MNCRDKTASVALSPATPVTPTHHQNMAKHQAGPGASIPLDSGTDQCDIHPELQAVAAECTPMADYHLGLIGGISYWQLLVGLGKFELRKNLALL